MRVIVFITFCLLFAGSAPQAIAQDVWPDRIELVGPEAPASNVYQASFLIQDGTGPISIDNTLIRINGNTIDLVAHVTIGPFSVYGFARDSTTLGALRPGNYTLRLYTVDTVGGPGQVEILQDTLQFTAMAGTTNSIPAIDTGSLIILAVLLGLLARRRMSAWTTVLENEK